MELGIIGLPQSGKTTVFNALTKGHAETGAHASGTLVPNIGVVKVPDPRLEALTDILKPKRTTPAEVRYVDVAGAAKGLSKGKGLEGELLAFMSKVDTLILVVRAFPDEMVPHIEGSVDPERDIDNMNLELAFSDLALIEKRLERLDTTLKGAKPQERELALREKALLARIGANLEKDIPLREQALTEEEAKTIANYQFLTAKPLLVLINLGEGQLGETASLEAKFKARYERPHLRIAALCGKLEMELGQLDDADAQEFRSAMNIVESSLDRVIRLSYELLGFISFFTIASNEVRAWTISQVTTALKAAGKVHTDMEKGFIRAEAIGYDDLTRCGSLAEARKRGLLRLEGKSYIVKDGDVITFLFNI